MCYLAFKRGYLSTRTLPIHTYILNSNGCVRNNVSKNYLCDLTENLLLADSDLRIHTRAKEYLGKLSELVYTYHLEQKGDRIVDTAAWGSQFDIVADNSEGQRIFYEIKHIGIDDEDFGRDLKSFEEKRCVVDSVCPDCAINHLFRRIYEATLQLEKVSFGEGRKVVSILIDESAWYQFAIHFDRGWVDWEKPRFLEDKEHCRRHVARIAKEWPGIRENLNENLQSISEIRVYTMSSNFGFRQVQLHAFQ